MPADTISDFGYTALNISDAKVKIINRDIESDKLFFICPLFAPSGQLQLTLSFSTVFKEE